LRLDARNIAQFPRRHNREQPGSVRAACASGVQQDDFDGLEKRPLRRLLLSTQPLAKLFAGYVEMLRQLVDTAQHQASAVQCARVNARVLGRRQWAILGGCGHLSHKRYRATLSAHTQVAIIERIVSLFGPQRVE
jgi:hypothetical protein